jgi:hypothetical protein
MWDIIEDKRELGGDIFADVDFAGSEVRKESRNSIWG